MLNISGLDNGIVLDHIPAGMSMEIYKYLNLGKLDTQVAIIKNASSKKMGKKRYHKNCRQPRQHRSGCHRFSESQDYS